MFRYLPEQASEIAPKVDWLNHIITDLSVFFTIAIVGTMLYFAFKYRARNGVDHATPRIEGSHFLELVWTIVPTLVCIFVGTYGILIFKEIRTVGENPIIINVTGKKWNWTFEYENGKQIVSEAVIPVGRPVKFVLTSRDVLHSFFVPAMRVKSDAIPNRFTYVTFNPVKTGDYQIFCTEYCGTDHSAMLARLKVVSNDDYDRWLHDESEKIKFNPAELGAQLYNQQGCVACHSVDGSKRVGPSFLKIIGREATYDGGKSYKADEEYINESILKPNTHIVDGYAANQMPSFTGILDDEKIKAIIAWMRTLDGSQASATAAATGGTPQFQFAKLLNGDDPSKMSPADRGKALYQAKACIGCHSLDGTKVVGPSWKGLYGMTNHKMADGTVVTVDDAYLKESILNSGAKIVEGFAPAMPSYQGQLSDTDVADIIEFIKTVK